MRYLLHKSSAPLKEPTFRYSSCLRLLCLLACRCAHKHPGIATATRETSDKHRAAYLAGVAAAREEVAIIVSMERDVQNTGVAVEGLLGAVAMVNVLDRDRGTGLECSHVASIINKSIRQTNSANQEVKFRCREELKKQPPGCLQDVPLSNCCMW